MSKSLPELDADLFKKQFPELTEKQLDKLEERILHLYLILFYSIADQIHRCHGHLIQISRFIFTDLVD